MKKEIKKMSFNIDRRKIIRANKKSSQICFKVSPKLKIRIDPKPKVKIRNKNDYSLKPNAILKRIKYIEKSSLLIIK